MSESNKKVDQERLLAEYQAAVDGFHHFDSFRWQSGALLIASSLVLWGLVLKDDVCSQTVGITGIFVTALLSIWILFAHHYRQLYMSKSFRIHQIESSLGMLLNRNLGFLGRGNIVIAIYGPRGHNLDLFVYVIVSIFGSIWSCINSGFSVWIVTPLPIIAVTLFLVLRNEKKMRNLYKCLMEPNPNNRISSD